MKKLMGGDFKYFFDIGTKIKILSEIKSPLIDSTVHLTSQKNVKVKVNDIFDMCLCQINVANSINISLVFDLMLHNHNLCKILMPSTFPTRIPNKLQKKASFNLSGRKNRWHPNYSRIPMVFLGFSNQNSDEK